MKRYAYIDKAGILHVVEKEEDARQYSKSGKYVATDIEVKFSYPVIKGEDIVMYGLEEAYINGNAGDGNRVNPAGYPGLVELYRQCI